MVRIDCDCNIFLSTAVIVLLSERRHYYKLRLSLRGAETVENVAI